MIVDWSIECFKTNDIWKQDEATWHFSYLFCDWLSRDIGAIATKQTTADCILIILVIQKFEISNDLLLFEVSFVFPT